MEDAKLRKIILDVLMTIKEGYSIGYNAVLTCDEADIPQSFNQHGESFPCSQVLIKALRTNTGYIYIGFDEDINVGNTHELIASEPLTIPIDDLAKLWFVATVQDEGISILVMV